MKIKGRLAVSKGANWKRTNVTRGRKIVENSVDEIESVRVGRRSKGSRANDPRDIAALSARNVRSFAEYDITR